MNPKQNKLARLCDEIATLDPAARAQVLQQLFSLNQLPKRPKDQLEEDDFKFLVEKYEAIGEVKLSVPLTLELEVTGNLTYEHPSVLSEDEALTVGNLDWEVKNKTKFEKDMGEFLHLDSYDIQDVLLKQPLPAIKEFRNKTSDFEKSLEKMAAKYDVDASDLYNDIWEKSQKLPKFLGKRKAGRKWRP